MRWLCRYSMWLCRYVHTVWKIRSIGVSQVASQKMARSMPHDRKRNCEPLCNELSGVLVQLQQVPSSVYNYTKYGLEFVNGDQCTDFLLQLISINRFSQSQHTLSVHKLMKSTHHIKQCFNTSWKAIFIKLAIIFPKCVKMRCTSRWQV